MKKIFKDGIKKKKRGYSYGNGRRVFLFHVRKNKLRFQLILLPQNRGNNSKQRFPALGLCKRLHQMDRFATAPGRRRRSVRWPSCGGTRWYPLHPGHQIPSSTVPWQSPLSPERAGTSGRAGTAHREQGAAASPAPPALQLISRTDARRQLTATLRTAARPALRHAAGALLRSHTRLPASPWLGKQFYARVALFSAVRTQAAGSRAISARGSERHGYHTYLHAANCSPLPLAAPKPPPVPWYLPLGPSYPHSAPPQVSAARC